MDQIHKNIAHFNLHIQFFPAFPYQSFFPAFAAFNFASDELPEQPAGLMRRTLTCQKPAFSPYESRNYFCHLI